MSERPLFSLETHEADDVESAVRLAIEEDTGGSLAYLIDHPREAKAFCERLKSDAPHQCITILTRLLQTLMTEEEGSEFVIEAEPVQNLKAAGQAAMEGRMAPVAAFLKAHPDQLRPFCNSFLGTWAGIRNAIGLALRSLRQGGSRDYYDVIAELISFLVDQNGENVRTVRLKIDRLLHERRMAEADDELVEAFKKQAIFNLGDHRVYTKVRFQSGGEGDPVPVEFVEELFCEEPNGNEAALRGPARPLMDAGISVNIIPTLENVPAFFVVFPETLNAAMTEGRLILKRKNEDYSVELEFDIQASASARAAALGIKVIR